MFKILYYLIIFVFFTNLSLAAVTSEVIELEIKMSPFVESRFGKYDEIHRQAFIRWCIENSRFDVTKKDFNDYIEQATVFIKYDNF